ncbi:MAG: PTPA-CTERM sorting domain-containing protein [Cyanobacteria bacterium J069]|nr:MAG: PTPA-CTERM sorting domain-containing protein [Cyanobacteria bacterium J069]
MEIWSLIVWFVVMIIGWLSGSGSTTAKNPVVSIPSPPPSITPSPTPSITPTPSPTPSATPSPASPITLPQTPTPDNTIPTPALLPGLIGMGIQMMRQRKQEDAAEGDGSEGDAEI